MTFSRDELIFICSGLRLIEEGDAKPIDKMEAKLLRKKIQMDLKAHENVWRPDYEQIRNRMGGLQLEPVKWVQSKM